MAEVTPGAVKSLREKTGAGMMECKRALQEAEGNEEQAIEILRKRGMASASKKAGRVAAEGAVGSYIHMGGKVGVLVEVDRKSTRLNSSHVRISYAVFCLKKKNRPTPLALFTSINSLSLVWTVIWQPSPQKVQTVSARLSIYGRYSYIEIQLVMAPTV